MTNLIDLRCHVILDSKVEALLSLIKSHRPPMLAPKVTFTYYLSRNTKLSAANGLLIMTA